VALFTSILSGGFGNETFWINNFGWKCRYGARNACAAGGHGTGGGWPPDAG